MDTDFSPYQLITRVGRKKNRKTRKRKSSCLSTKQNIQDLLHPKTLMKIWFCGKLKLQIGKDLSVLNLTMI